MSHHIIRTTGGRFAPGYAPNPGGRPREGEDVKEQLRRIRAQARAAAPEALGVLYRIAVNPKSKPADAAKASALLLEWAFGPPAKLEPDAVSDACHNVLAGLPTEDRIAMLEAAIAYEKGEPWQLTTLPSLERYDELAAETGDGGNQGTSAGASGHRR